MKTALFFYIQYQIQYSLIHPAFSFTLSLQLCKVQSFIIHSFESFWNIKQNVKFKGRENKALETLQEKQYYEKNSISFLILPVLTINHSEHWIVLNAGKQNWTIGLYAL